MSELIAELSRSALYKITDKTVVLDQQPGYATRHSSTELVGETLDSKYQILRLLGTGGMGCVYLAYHLLLHKQVALKTFKSSNFTDAERLRFQREAQAIARLSHANVIQVFDFGYAFGGTVPYYTMEHLRGESLREKIQRDGALSESETIFVFKQVCRGLVAAHHKGIIHRDLKPDNFFLSMQSGVSRDVQVKIIDFGIATLALPDSDAQKLTVVGLVFGSPLYMSPEQSLGRSVTAQSDIYSCGCALFQALTGEPPYLGATAFDTLRMHQESPVPRLSDVLPQRQFAPGWQRLIGGMLAKNLDERYADVESVLAQLDVIASHLEVSPAVRTPLAANALLLGTDLDLAEGDRVRDVKLDQVVDDLEEPEPTKKPSKLAIVITIGLIVLSCSGELAWLGLSDAIKNDKKKSAQKSLSLAASNTTSSENKPAEAAQPTTYMQKMHSRAIDVSDEPVQLDAVLSKQSKNNSVDFNGCRITFATLQRIANTPWITEVKLEDANIDNLGLSQLKTLPLSNILLDGSNFDDTGAAALAQCQTLLVVSCEITKLSPVGMAHLASLKQLIDLSLEGETITDAHLAPLARCKQLRYLKLINCFYITASGLEHLKHVPIEGLDLDHCSKIDDLAVKKLISLKHLKSLNLSATRVTAGGVRELCSKLKYLADLHIVNCPGISPADAAQLQKDFPQCRIEIKKVADMPAEEL